MGSRALLSKYLRSGGAPGETMRSYNYLISLREDLAEPHKIGTKLNILLTAIYIHPFWYWRHFIKEDLYYQPPPYTRKVQVHSKYLRITRQYTSNLIIFLKQHLLCVFIISLVRHIRHKNRNLYHFYPRTGFLEDPSGVQSSLCIGLSVYLFFCLCRFLEIKTRGL